MFWNRKYRARRAEIRKNRPDTGIPWQQLRSEGVLVSLGLAAIFCALAVSILLLRQEVMRYRLGQYVSHAIHARVAFSFQDNAELNRLRENARAATPHVFTANGDAWEAMKEQLLLLPERMEGKTVDTVPQSLRNAFRLEAAPPFIVADLDSATVTMLDQYSRPPRRQAYEEMVEAFIRGVKDVYVLSAEEREAELKRQSDAPVPRVTINSAAERLSRTYALGSADLLEKLHEQAAAAFPPELQMKIVAFTANTLQPTHRYNEAMTAAAQEQAAAAVSPSEAVREYAAGQELVKAGSVIDEQQRRLLRAEHHAFLASLDAPTRWLSNAGLIGYVALVTGLLAFYIHQYQRRIVRNHARAVALGLLLLSMLLLAQLSAVGTGPLYVFGTAPTILVAMIVAIAYDRRFAMGIATFHGILVTLALAHGIGFFLVLVVGSFVCCYLLDEIRTRSKLIEVGGLTAASMMIATLAAGAMSLDPVEPLRFTIRNALHAGAAGLSVGFIVLGILPFIEKMFRITTSMTLLELADASQPLMRRLQMEAPGTYNHSLQVATLSEAAAEAIGANSLLCRVGSYYHDIGKINKAEYFVENQTDGRNRHLNLSPNVSLLIIIGHVKDGLELAREYHLPTSLFPFIQQHHGTMVVEYFFRQARDRQQPDGQAISDAQYRYPGPKPRSREVAIVMLADAVESACRCLGEPSPGRIEDLVKELSRQRLDDGQFDECELTMRELQLIERALIKTVVGIYHGRVAYPSTAAVTSPAASPAASARTA